MFLENLFDYKFLPPSDLGRLLQLFVTRRFAKKKEEEGAEKGEKTKS